ncbi:Multidrug resistance-associated protein [Blattamonas nauphoetae]|uniref:Multidrug resistance-associated protein n=1 Tax=Blattamonas nauphoetae TaxID=2049346 RepID=A0ABQ9XP47_9EUKA|nr:Multidrug resistance-associated protein [Blattamonas nauphoetae]
MFMSFVKDHRILIPLGVVILFLLNDVAAEAVSLVSTCWLGNISNPTAMGGMGFWWKIGVDGFLALGLLQEVMDHLMSCLSSFFDTTPMGRILNMFTGDIPQVDQFLFSRFLSVISMWVGLIGQVVIVGVDTPWFLFMGIPVIVLYVILPILYSRVSRNFQRIESIARSLVLSHFSETISGAGLTTIRSYGREEEWKEKIFEVNNMSVPFMLFREGQKWASLNASVISSLLNCGMMIIGWFFMDVSKLSVAIMLRITLSNLGVQVIRLVELDPKLAPKMIDMKTGFTVDADPNEEPSIGR